MSRFTPSAGAGAERLSPRFQCTVLALCCAAALTFGAWQYGNLSQAHQAADANAGQDKAGKEAKPAAADPKLEPERVNFRSLILGNPNAFGNLKDSELKPIIANFALSNTNYEEIKCVGYNPQFSRLEAVVHIKQTGGYGGELCQTGTPEYVRFFVDWDNNGSWTDEGVVSFIVHDVPGPKPLEYDATLPIAPRMKFCFQDNLPKVRAILSWDNPPPANAPNVMPVWGNVMDARIQMRPRNLIILSDLLKEAKVANLKDLEAEVDLDQPLTAPKPKDLTPAELQAQYKDKVPEHRFLYPLLQPLVANPDATAAALAPGSKGLFPELGVDLGKIIGTIQKTDGDTTFEELKCIGFNANQSLLAGVLTVKKSIGYSGNLCTPGSQEYVAFWLDWGSGFTYAGTTSVAVHDLQNIPPEGIQYAVELPVNLSAHQQPCYLGPVAPRVRAILSWQVAPPPANPNFTPTWGNRMESTLLVNPGPKTTGQVPFLSAVGDVPEININGGGTATGNAIHTNFVCADSPFGGRITVAGPHFQSGSRNALPRHEEAARRRGLRLFPAQQRLRPGDRRLVLRDRVDPVPPDGPSRQRLLLLRGLLPEPRRRGEPHGRLVVERGRGRQHLRPAHRLEHGRQPAPRRPQQRRYHSCRQSRSGRRSQHHFSARSTVFRVHAGRDADRQLPGQRCAFRRIQFRDSAKRPAARPAARHPAVAPGRKPRHHCRSGFVEHRRSRHLVRHLQAGHVENGPLRLFTHSLRQRSDQRE